MSSNIKRAVSLYSYQEEYFLRKMSLEECIAAAAANNAPSAVGGDGQIFVFFIMVVAAAEVSVG